MTNINITNFRKDIYKLLDQTIKYNEQGWKNGMFLVKIPSDIVYAEINDVSVKF